MGLIERLGAGINNALAVKAAPLAATATKAVPFPIWAGGGMRGGGGYGYDSGWASNYWATQPGAKRDYAATIGDVLQNSVVAACIDAKTQAVMEAPPILEEKQADGKWVRVEHPLLELLLRPNPFQGDDHLWATTVSSEDVSGNGYWRIVWGKKGTPVELWPVSIWETPVGLLYGKSGRYIDGYNLWVDGKAYLCNAASNVIEDGDTSRDAIIHFRQMLNPYNQREGRTSLTAGYRQIEGANGVASYNSALVRNCAVASLLVSVKDSGPVGSPAITPDQMAEVIRALEAKLTGEGAGRIAGSGLPVSVDKMSFSPDEMGIDELISYFESHICALERVPPMVVAMAAGRESRTYSNYAEALQDFWRRTIRPLLNRHASELNAQLLPLFGLDRSKYRIGFDFSQVWALQADVNLIHDRIRQDWSAQMIDLYTAKSETGYTTDDKDRGVYITLRGGVQPESLDPAQRVQPRGSAPRGGPAGGGDAGSAAKFDASQPRDDTGKWTDGSSSGGGSGSSVSDNPAKWRGLTKEYANKPPTQTFQFKDYEIGLHPIDGEEDSYLIAKDKDNNVVGSLFFGDNMRGTGDMEGAVEVKPSHRRKGIATELYRLAEKIAGKTFAPAQSHTDAAAALWQQPDRPFGHKSAKSDGSGVVPRPAQASESAPGLNGAGNGTGAPQTRPVAQDATTKPADDDARTDAAVTDSPGLEAGRE